MRDRFELLEKIGRGGMGVVWKARDTDTGEIVAVKLLHEMYADDPDYVARFEREVEVARRIVSPHVVQILGFGRQQGRPLLAMEFVAGRNLREVVRASGPLPWARVREIAWQVADGIAAAHDAGVIHRDIKPSNILLGHDGIARLADFGVARALDLSRLTGSHTFLGSPEYMAPDPEPGLAADLYGLGCIMYEMLCGEPPFSGESIQQVLYRHIRDQPDVSRLPAESRAVVAALLDKDPTRRPADLHVVLRPPSPPPWPVAAKRSRAMIRHVADFSSGRESPVSALVAMPREPLLVAGTAEGALYAWRGTDPAAVRTAPRTGDAVRSLSADPGGRYVLVAGDTGVRRWDVATGSIEHVLAGTFSTVVALSQGRWAALDEAGTLRIFSLHREHRPVPKYLHDGEGNTCLAVSPGGKWLAIGGGRGKVTIVTTDSWWPSFRSPERGSPVRTMSFASQSSLRLIDAEGVVCAWAFGAHEGKPAEVMYVGSVEQCQFLEDGAMAAVARPNGSVHLLLLDADMTEAFPFSAVAVTATAAVSQGRVAFGREDGNISLFAVDHETDWPGE